MSRSEILEEDREALYTALDQVLSDDSFNALRKKAISLADEIAENIEYSVQSNLASNLSYHVREMAGRAVEALLNGNHDEMVRWLQCDSRTFNGRSDGYNTNRTIEQQHPVIHGKLFDSGAVALRRRIVEAHRDLITEQRLLDLEDQVKSLVAQNNKLERELEDSRERARIAM